MSARMISFMLLAMAGLGLGLHFNSPAQASDGSFKVAAAHDVVPIYEMEEFARYMRSGDIASARRTAQALGNEAYTTRDGRSAYVCTLGNCTCHGFQDCINLAVNEQCTVEVATCRDCHTISGSCTKE